MRRFGMRGALISLGLFLSVASCGSGGGGGSDNPTPVPTPTPTPFQTPSHAETMSILEAHMNFLASDALGGRYPGTDGENQAIDYIIDQFDSYGFEPGFDTGWTQAVPLVALANEEVRFKVGETIISGPDMFLYDGPDGENDFPFRNLVAIDSIEDIPEHLTTHIAVIEVNENYVELTRVARERNPLAIVYLYADEAVYREREIVFWADRYKLDIGAGAYGFPTIILGPQSAASLLEALGTDMDGFRADPGLGVADVYWSSTERLFEGRNVLAKLPGSDPNAGSVFILAHHDHIGTCGYEGDEDRICNGAIDNASGIASTLETARRLAGEGGLKRTVYILTTTGEEYGIFGSEYFLRTTAMRLEDIHAVVNIDTVALAPKDAPMTVIGWGRTPLDQAIIDVIAEQGRTLQIGPESEQFYNRQDGVPFIRRGVPTVFPTSAFVQSEAFDRYFRERYHRPTDEMDDMVELGGAASDIPFFVGIVQRYSDPDQLPASLRTGTMYVAKEPLVEDPLDSHGH